jgi:type I restriction enzyme S subunit
MIDLNPNHLDTIKRILAEYVPDCEVRAFGSRVKWTAKDYSDLDLAIIGKGKIDRKCLNRLEEAFENSELPVRVDVLDWWSISENFRNVIDEQCEIVQNGKTCVENGNLTFGKCAKLIRDGIQPDKMKSSHYIGLEHIEQGTLHINDTGSADDVSSMKSVFRKGDILFGKLRPYFRKVVRAPFDGVCSTDIWVVRSIGDIDQSFLFYWMASQEFVNFSMQGSEGTKMPRAKWDHVSRHQIPLFNIDEQRAIAHLLGTLDDKIELNRRMNETLEAMAHALFKSWFIDFDPVIDNALAAGKPIPEEFQELAAARESLGDARKLLPEEVRNLFSSEFEHTKEHGWIPKGWKVKAVNQIIIINPSVSLKKATEASFIDMKALPTTGYAISEVILKAYSGGAKFQNGDVLLARITPCLENGKTGIVDFLDGDDVGFGSTEFIVLRRQGNIQTPFIACLARDTRFRNHCIQSMVGSSGRQRVQNACFSNYYLAIPEQDGIMIHFQQLTQISFDKMTKHTEQSRSLTSLRDTLLPKLLSGEVRISKAEKFEELET